MSDLRKIVSLGALLFLCAGATLIPAQTTKKTAAAKSGTGASAAAQPIAVHGYQLEGVELALMEVTRTAPDVVTVKWEYRNKTAKAQTLADIKTSKGWSDPYRLSWDSYLLLEDGKTKVPVMTDKDRRPIAAALGQPVQDIVVGPKKSLKNWAKYSVPGSAKALTFVVPGAEPFEGVTIAEPPAEKSK
jgi:hypothetical protein